MNDNESTPPTSTASRWRRRLLPGLILVLGLVGAMGLVATRPQPARVATPRPIPVVATMDVEARTDALLVEGTGTVRPRARITLSAEVGGRVVAVSPSLARGGAFREGDILFALQDDSYVNAVAIARAEVRQREVDVALAEQEQVIARREYELLRARTGAAVADTSLAARLAVQQPQLDAAHASLARAEALLADAVLDLERTVVRAPFDGRVLSETIDAGQFVSAGQGVAEIYATDVAEVGVSLTTRQAALIDGLWNPASAMRVPVEVRAEFGGTWYSWDGFVDRTAGALDDATRTIEVVVQVPGPFANDDRPPLLIGTYVRAGIRGGTVEPYFAIPRPALRDESRVWMLNADGTLSSAPVEVVQEVQDSVYVRADLGASPRIVVSDLAVMTEDMRVSTIEQAEEGTP